MASITKNYISINLMLIPEGGKKPLVVDKPRANGQIFPQVFRKRLSYNVKKDLQCLGSILESNNTRSALLGTCATVAVVFSTFPMFDYRLPAQAAQLYPCENTEQYYSSVQGLQGDSLKSKLHSIISGHKVYSYSQVWDALKILDAADEATPGQSNDIVEIYSQKRAPKEDAAKPEGWNREHLWPRSFGLTLGLPQFSDLHNLRPADVNVNSSRGNKVYGECSADVDSSCQVPANREAAPDTASNKLIWQPPAQARGDIARALLYMAVRYEGEEPGSLDLELSDHPDRASGRMGYLSTLLRWHAEDPPSASERLRNERICSLFQHNRNPFVDHPQFVGLIWGSQSAPPASLALPSDGPGLAWINEFHYSNEGPDVNEFVEVVVGPNIKVEDLVLYLYNGNKGTVYNRIPLISFSEGQQLPGSFKILAKYIPSGIQNGPVDGIALVSESTLLKSKVIQFLSYGGVMTGSEGPALGIPSVDIGLRESNKSKPDGSLGLSGFGGIFQWKSLSKATFGALNVNQGWF